MKQISLIKEPSRRKLIPIAAIYQDFLEFWSKFVFFQQFIFRYEAAVKFQFYCLSINYIQTDVLSQ
jgi:hypothetical protein